MSTPGFDPTAFLNQLARYDPNLARTIPSLFSFQIDPSQATTEPLTAVIDANAPEYAGLYSEWTARTRAGNAPAGVVTTAQFDVEITGLFGLIAAQYPDIAGRMVFPRSWDTFITQFRNYFGLPNTNTRAGDAFDGFKNQFKSFLQIGSPTSDWAGILSSDAPTADAQISAAFVSSFDGFLGSYPFSKTISATTGNVTFDDQNLPLFVNNWRHFMTVIATHESETTQAGASIGLMSYEQVFKAFFPNASQADFDAEMQRFVSAIMADQVNGGYFVPSHYFSQFFEEMRNKYLVLQASQGTVQAGAGARLAILWKIFALVSDMVQTIQKAAVVSAQRLGFYTAQQKAYTELISRIPSFTNDNPFNSDNTGSVNAKNQAFAETLRSLRDLIGDEAKTLQSNVNALNDASNQQSSLITNILQQMQSLMSSITK